MPIDGCRYCFDELVSNVLPGYMRQLRKRMAEPIPMSELAVLGEGPTTIARRYGLAGDLRGCYVLLDEDRPIYVGISRFVLSRVRQHLLGRSHYDATLAYTMTARKLGGNGTRNDAMQDAEFMAAFAAAKARLAQLNVAFVEIDNAVERHLFEVYAAMELGTSDWNSFETH